MNESECMLTTVDNPFDPFEQFDAWLNYDTEKGYYSASRWTRFANFRDDMSEEEENEEIERAIDEFIEVDFLDLFKKVKRTKKTDTNHHDTEA